MHLPMFIDLTHKRILVAGGGAVAGRRIRVLFGFCRHITVVAPEISPEINSLGLDIYRREFKPSDLDGKDIVLAATDDAQVNRQIAGLCRRRGILVNNCSDQRLCDFQFPAVVQSGDIVIGINSSGKNHGLVRETRRKIESMENFIEE